MHKTACNRSMRSAHCAHSTDTHTKVSLFSWSLREMIIAIDCCLNFFPSPFVVASILSKLSAEMRKIIRIYSHLPETSCLHTFSYAHTYYLIVANNNIVIDTVTVSYVFRWYDDNPSENCSRLPWNQVLARQIHAHWSSALHIRMSFVFNTIKLKETVCVQFQFRFQSMPITSSIHIALCLCAP